MICTCSGKSFSQEGFELIRSLFAEVPVNEQPATQDTTRRTQEERCTVHSAEDGRIFENKEDANIIHSSRGTASTTVDNMDTHVPNKLIGATHNLSLRRKSICAGILARTRTGIRTAAYTTPQASWLDQPELGRQLGFFYLLYQVDLGLLQVCWNRTTVSDKTSKY